MWKLLLGNPWVAGGIAAGAVIALAGLYAYAHHQGYTAGYAKGENAGYAKGYKAGWVNGQAEATAKVNAASAAERKRQADASAKAIEAAEKDADQLTTERDRLRHIILENEREAAGEPPRDGLGMPASSVRRLNRLGADRGADRKAAPRSPSRAP